MAKLSKLTIKNFRGIRDLTLDFDISQNLVCLVGRGDSGKTTVLEAISNVLSSNWNLTIHDTDFFDGDAKNTIDIEATLVNLPDKIISINKFGLYLRLLNIQTKEIFDDVLAEDILEVEDESLVPCLTIKLTVDDSLEPRWFVTTSRDQEDRSITSSERSELHCFMITDYIDRHFSWSKGNPLHALLKAAQEEGTIGKFIGEDNVIVNTMRVAKKKIDEHDFEELKDVTESIVWYASSLGLDIAKTTTTLDFKDLFIKDGRISLHEDFVPFRLKGKGSKRLASLAIQLALVKEGGIMLVDEIEQGLEPDRIKQLIRTLQEEDNGQIFLTTHSRDVITELGPHPIYFLLKDPVSLIIEHRGLGYSADKHTAVVRACPEAFFARKVIVCEGATEIGICRALDQYRKSKGKELLSFKDCAYVDGVGDSMIDRAHRINDVLIKTVLFCDSDKPAINSLKEDLTEKGVLVLDCESDNCLETQVFNDLPWEAIKELLGHVVNIHKGGNVDKLTASVQSKLPSGKVLTIDWLDAESEGIRSALAKAATVKDNEWFKRTDRGEILGDVIFKHFDSIPENHIKKTLNALSDWVDS